MSSEHYAFKYLNADGTPCNGGTGQWLLPSGTQPARWMPLISELIPCKQGYHLCREEDLLKWSGPVLALAEYRGKSIVHENSKLVVAQARIVKVYGTWNERMQRLFACDCAEHVAHIYTAYKSDGWQPKDTIEVVRRFADGKATIEELTAARIAARTAARVAARTAARTAAEAAAGYAAWTDAWTAAGYAARYAARVDARTAARTAARDAAGYAAEAAAGYAAWTDARDAEYQWQTARLMDYIEGRMP